MAKTVRFASRTCGRCGGSGHYSYCQRYGTTCFGCSGRKRVLTKAGAAARVAFDAWALATYGIDARDLTPGLVIPFEFAAVGSELTLYTRRVRVATVALDGDGSVALTFANRTVESEAGTHSIPGSYRLLLKSRLSADWGTVLTFAATLPGATIVDSEATDEEKAALAAAEAAEQDALLAKKLKAADRRSAKAALKAVALDAELDGLLADAAVTAKAAAEPHPRGFGGKSLLDYAVWMRANASGSGRVMVLRRLKELV